LQTHGRHPRHSKAALGALLACLLFAPLPVRAARHSPGTLSQGVFTPELPPFPAYGSEGDRPCPKGGGLFDLVPDDLAAAAKAAGRPEPRTDGRLCALAETLLGWPTPGTPPEHLVAFLSRYFGLVSPTPDVFVTIENAETDDSRVVADKVVATVKSYLPNLGRLRYGMAAERLPKDRQGRVFTRVVIALVDESLVLEPFPRRLAPKASAALVGSLAGDLENPHLLLSGQRGQLLEPAQAPGKTLRAEISCEEKPARLYVEVKADEAGKPRTVASFPVYCGLEPPASVPEKDSWPAEVSKGERRVLEEVNGERALAGLSPLAWDERLAEVARGLADAYAEQVRTGRPALSDAGERLEKAGVAASVVLVNPSQAGSAEQAERQTLENPPNRANFMSPEVTNAGVGLSLTTRPGGEAAAILVEIFVKVIPPLDIAETRKALAAAIAKRRSDEHKPALADDPALAEVAQSYARELAADKGDLPPDREDSILAPLKAYANLNVLLGASRSPLAFANESKALASGDHLGVGVAQGDHPKFGKNTPYVVVIIGTSRPPEKKKGKK